MQIPFFVLLSLCLCLSDAASSSRITEMVQQAGLLETRNNEIRAYLQRVKYPLPQEYIDKVPTLAELESKLNQLLAEFTKVKEELRVLEDSVADPSALPFDLQPRIESKKAELKAKATALSQQLQIYQDASSIELFTSLASVSKNFLDTLKRAQEENIDAGDEKQEESKTKDDSRAKWHASWVFVVGALILIVGGLACAWYFLSRISATTDPCSGVPDPQKSDTLPV